MREPRARFFDFIMAEMYAKEVDPAFLWRTSRDARQRGQAMVFTGGQRLSTTQYRLAIAGCYASGMEFIVPWDQCAGKGARVFARPQSLADLYGFVRANAAYLDGYEDAAAWGPKIEDPRWDEPPVKIEGGTCFAFARATPGDAAAPVVIHLVQPRGKPPFLLTVLLRTKAFFGERPLTVAFSWPPEYNESVHAEAEQSGDYSKLAVARELGVVVEGEHTKVHVHGPRPWGLLVVEAE
jgi:hypothetical protein